MAINIEILMLIYSLECPLQIITQLFFVILSYFLRLISSAHFLDMITNTTQPVPTNTTKETTVQVFTTATTRAL